MADTLPSPAPRREARPENLWINLACNAAWPALVLSQLSKPHRLGPAWALVVALALPLGYGIYDLVRRRKWNVFSVVAVIGTLLTGGLGLLRLDNFWFAVKEAALPFVLGLALPLSLRTRQPLVRELLCNDQVLDMPRIRDALVGNGRLAEFERLLGKASWIVASSFFLSAVLNYLLARWLLQSAPGTPEHAAELGRLTGLSYPIIVLPSMALMFLGMWKLLTGLEKLTGLDAEALFRAKKGRGGKVEA